MYLPPSSAHTKHVFKAIPFVVVSTLRRNCSEEIFLNKRLVEYKGFLVDQGYPAELVSREFSRAASIPRNDLLKAKVGESKKSFPSYFPLTYNPNLPSINGLMKNLVRAAIVNFMGKWLKNVLNVLRSPIRWNNRL